MTRSRRALLGSVASVAVGILALGIRGHGAEVMTGIRFAHTPHIANDGRITFSYLGDIWSADADGSRAQRLTTHIANDFGPKFSPDGQWIAFTSTRTGNNDVFVIPRNGGEPRQLTFYSGDDQALYWTPDGKALLIASNRGAFPFGSPLYRLPVDGGAEEPLDMAFARLGMIKQDGTLLAFNRTLPSQGVWRKGFRGNSAPGIAVEDLATHTAVAITNGDPHDYRSHFQDVYPMWGADGLIYFTSERDGVYNLWRIQPRGGAAQQVTRFKDGGVFYPSISPDGHRVIFQHDFDLWTLDVPNGSPRRLVIPLSVDPKENDTTIMTVKDLAAAFSPSPDAESVAIETRGDIQLIPAQQGFGEDTRVARTPWRESAARYAPDGKQIAYLSDESGDQEIWLFDVTTGERRQLTMQSSEKRMLAWAPDSKRLLYQADNRIWQIDTSPAAKPIELVFNASGFSTVTYAANGTWLAYARPDDASNVDGYLYDIGGRREYNVTKHPSTDFSPVLTPDGKTVLFVSGRNDNEQLFAVSLSHLTEDRNDPLVRQRLRASAGGRGARAGGGPASALEPAASAAGTPAPAAVAAENPPSSIDLEGIDKRAVALTERNESVNDFFLSADGRTVYFTAEHTGEELPDVGLRPPAAGGPDASAPALFAMSVDGRDRRTVSTGIFSTITPTPDRRFIFFNRPAPQGNAGSDPNVVGGRPLFRMSLQNPRLERVTFTFPIRIDRRAEWKQMLSETWRVLKDRYYDAGMNGIEWQAIRAKYLPMLAHVGTHEDFYDLANAMVGELRSSHLNVTGPPTYTIPAVYTTRSLGFELAVQDNVHRIAHIYRNGPADKEWLGLAVGDVVLAIDGQSLKAGESYWKLLAAATNEYIAVKVAKTPNAEPRTVRIASVTNLTDIKYNDFVERNRELVEKKTKGRIAYAHIRQMDPASLQQFRRDISRDLNKDGIIVDVRYNNGGNIDEPILEILARRPYMFVTNRYQARIAGRRPSQTIAGPKVMLINQRSFSDAEATPMGFRTLGLGPLVGTPTAGGVIWTNTYQLINGATIRVPNALAAVYDPTKSDRYGTNLENYGVPPDVWVQNSLNDERSGIDRELDTAIDEVMRMLAPSAASH
jgi:tricorn protease